MNANTKNCAYKGCGNTTSRDGHLTFFGFPLKNAKKCRIWAVLAGIDVPISKQLYLCEAHFNPIFLSRTPRRKVLLPKAVPYAYRAEEEEYVEKDSSTLDLINSVASIYDPDEADGNEEIIEPKDDHDDKDDHVDRTESNDGSAIENGSKVEKRSTFDSSHLNCNNVTKRQKIHADEKFTDNVHIIIDNTIANPDIATFIYKDEEYIQMPKSIYLQQRSDLNAELQKYKKMVASIKHLINNFNM